MIFFGSIYLALNTQVSKLNYTNYYLECIYDNEKLIKVLFAIDNRH